MMMMMMMMRGSRLGLHNGEFVWRNLINHEDMKPAEAADFESKWLPSEQKSVASL
jgi:hypothetical protein